MPREERAWHPRFIAYMDAIIHHPNYQGLPIEQKKDGSYKWLATAKTKIGQARIDWCRQKARELGIPIQPGVYAEVMLQIHPTKQKVCQTCGREMSLFYLYPNGKFLEALNQHFHSDFTICDSIEDIWDALEAEGFRETEVAAFLIRKGGLSLNADAGRSEILRSLEHACRTGQKKCLGPGAMSNFPDRFDGFHSYNRCCRGSQDKGRSKENLKTYNKDRRAYEYWSGGNIHAANQFMASSFFDGTSADHIGPISLGFVHDPRYLQRMPGGDNSTKRDRLQPEDLQKILEIEARTGVYPVSWYAGVIWEHIRANWQAHPEKVSGPYRGALKQNMTDFMFVLWTILDRCGKDGERFLVSSFLEPNFDSFRCDYIFDTSFGQGDIIGTLDRHFTERNRNEMERYQRIAIESVYDYMDKKNRNTDPDLTPGERNRLAQICLFIPNITNSTDAELTRRDVENLMDAIQRRLIAAL